MRVPQPADLVLKRAPRYQRVRRTVLALSCASLFVGPLWQLAHANAQWAGLAGGGRWGALASHLPHGQPPLLGAPWTLETLGLEWLDPLAVLSVVASRGFGWQLVLGLLPVLALMVVLGRFFCGWLCPYVPILAASNAARALLARVGFKPLDLQLPRSAERAVLLAVIVASSLGGAPLVALVYPPAIIGRSVASAIWSGSVGAGALVLLAIFLFDTLVSRAGFCRSLCPGGALFTLLSWRSPVRVKREPAKCTDCTACDVVCNLGQKPMSDQLDSGCERCGKCIAVCPTVALRFEVKR